jgi:6-pyruvoyltetrahydropterin/6-carboxytetrahydropterin synthase
MRRIQFCSGHRLVGHESKCSHLHGHNYVAMIHCEADQLDGVGRVVDFSCIKDVIGNWIDEQWDHGMILHQDDPNAHAIATANLGGVGRQKLYLMAVNPTAENMAAHLLQVGNQLFERAHYSVRVVKVVLWETENCFAEVTV